jgi:hypothetical protein
MKLFQALGGLGAIFAIVGAHALAQANTSNSAPRRSSTSAQTNSPSGNDPHSIDETLRWITGQVDKFGGSSYQVTYPTRGYTWHHSNAYDNLKISGCVMTFEQRYQNNARPARAIRYSVPLADLASATYQADRGSRQFHYRPGIAALFLRSHTKSMHWSRPKTNVATDLAEIEFGAESSANEARVNRVGKAFMYLQSLCASQTPKTSSLESAPELSGQ